MNIEYSEGRGVGRQSALHEMRGRVRSFLACRIMAAFESPNGKDVL